MIDPENPPPPPPGVILVSREARAIRLAICATCPHFTPLKRCSKCGCFMLIKAWIAKMTCPDSPKRWDKQV